MNPTHPDTAEIPASSPPPEALGDANKPTLIRHPSRIPDTDADAQRQQQQ